MMKLTTLVLVSTLSFPVFAEDQAHTEHGDDAPVVSEPSQTLKANTPTGEIPGVGKEDFDECHIKVAKKGNEIAIGTTLVNSKSKKSYYIGSSLRNAKDGKLVAQEGVAETRGNTSEFYDYDGHSKLEISSTSLDKDQQLKFTIETGPDLKRIKKLKFTIQRGLQHKKATEKPIEVFSITCVESFAGV